MELEETLHFLNQRRFFNYCTGLQLAVTIE